MCDVLYFKLNGIYACGQQNHQSYNYLEKGHHLPVYSVKLNQSIDLASSSFPSEDTVLSRPRTNKGTSRQGVGF